ncbi:MAG: DUF3488 and transglutaminase-like domain-containing protein [Desulfobacterales bacterium]|nr:DUF3488 and transglutaminase-like domain-containing protein [Desulfobacterales bacterium]
MTSKFSSIPMMLAATAAAFAPHAGRMPVWVLIWCAAAWGWGLLIWKQKTGWPPRWGLNLLAFAGFIGALASFGFAFDRTAGVTILSVMLSLKPLEARTYRDRMITVFLVYFLILSNLLFSNALPMFFYMLGSVALTTMLLVRIQDPEGKSGRHAALAGGTVLLALPVMALFFFLFPRIPGGIFRLTETTTARAGFTQEMSPGSVCRLVLSRDIAFRVELAQAQVPPGKRYWRGVVYSDFDGRSWRSRPQPPAALSPEPGGETVVQQIELEPHQQRWLFALDLPFDVSTAAVAHADYTFKAPEPIKERIRYRALSAMRRPARTPAPEEAARYLRIPPAGNPDARDLAARWQKESRSPAEIVKRALAFFGRQEFVYSLNPPLLGDNPIDEFLFQSRKGFCEHYASAFAFLMRAVGLPSRIVGGYLGGEPNPFGGYLIVRQSDAHAWVEVWLPDQGWIRIDPTGVVAPERAEGGTEAAIPPGERIHGYPLAGIPIVGAAARNLFLGLDAANTFWNRRIMGYSAGAQRRLLGRLGISADSWKEPAAVFGGGLLLISAIGVLVVLRPHPSVDKRRDPVQKAYLNLCVKLAKAGVLRLPSQGPYDLMAEVSRIRPDLVQRLGPVIERYVLLRYGRRQSPAERSQFLKEVRRLSLNKRPPGAESNASVSAPT